MGGKVRSGIRASKRGYAATVISIVLHAGLLIAALAVGRISSSTRPPQPEEPEPVGFVPLAGARTAAPPISSPPPPAPASISPVRGASGGGIPRPSDARRPVAARPARLVVRTQPVPVAARDAEALVVAPSAPERQSLPETEPALAVSTNRASAGEAGAGALGPTSAGTTGTARVGGLAGGAPAIVAAAVAGRMLLAHPDPDCADANADSADEGMGRETRREVRARICVSAAGAVTSVTELGGSDDLSRCVCRYVKSSWSYRPMSVDGRAVPFCYVAAFVFE